MRAGAAVVVAGVEVVDELGAIELERERALAIALLREQHALDVGVLDDADLRLAGVLASGTDRSALRPALRILERCFVAGEAEHRRAQADGDARLIHHVEHAAQALALSLIHISEPTRLLSI